MNRQFGSRAREDNDGQTRRRLKENEEKIIRVPAFDNSDLIAKFKQTLSGRMFHADGRSVEALLKHMPKRRIWDVEGRVRGTNLGNNKFHFDFDREEDLIKVLEKRPCHFNKWSFSLERSTPTIKEDFPSSLPFWAVVSGVPIHYKKQETYESVGKALGVFDKADVEGSRVRVFVNGDLPLKFDCKIGFAGDVVKVTIQYEDLYRHCYSCKRLSHEEGTCPELNEDQRARNRLARIEQKEKEERATKEAFSIPQRQTSGAYIDSYRHESRGGETRPTYQGFPKFRRESRREEENDHDLRKQLKERREVHSKNVWNRLDSGQYSELPRNRDKYIHINTAQELYQKRELEILLPRPSGDQKDHRGTNTINNLRGPGIKQIRDLGAGDPPILREPSRIIPEDKAPMLTLGYGTHVPHHRGL